MRAAPEQRPGDDRADDRADGERAGRRDLRRARRPAEVAGPLGGPRALHRRRRRRRLGGAREALRAHDVPLPLGRPAHGPRRGVRAARRDRALLALPRLRGAQPDRLGLLRAARGERGDPQRRAPVGVHLRQHRHPGGVDEALRALLRLVAAAAHLRPRLLPLDAVALLEVPRARAGLPQEQPRQLVPAGPDGAGQRAGGRRRVRALRRDGDQARADAVVLPDHRVRPGAARRAGHAGEDLALAGDQRAAQLDRPVRGCARRLRRARAGTSRCASTPRARTRSSARPSWSSPPTPRWPPSCAPTTSGRRTRSTWRACARPRTSTGCRPSAPRRACSSACTPPTR